MAANQLQGELKLSNSTDLLSGKMYGVLVILDSKGQLGFLKAFSGQVTDSKNEICFVPPLHDRLKNGDFFKNGEQELIRINNRVHELQNDPKFQALVNQLEKERSQSIDEIEHLSSKNKFKKQKRSELRNSNLSIAPITLEEESKADHFALKDLKKNWKLRLKALSEELKPYHDELISLKKKRKLQSAQLQQQLFDQYTFLNALGESKNLSSIFSHLSQPPAGAGDCCAPKLLQFAFQHNIKPVAMGEFWFGNSPKSELRTQGNFYPSCSSKCKPILSHMLNGMNLEPDPISEYKKGSHELDIIYSDEYVVVVNKPIGLLSVPSKVITDSVYNRILNLFPDSTGPIIVHRLDKLTSGLMVIAKSQEAHKALQGQFIDRSINKQYVALLNGNITKQKGVINLPIAPDINDRPRHIVDHKLGKEAITYWQLIEIKSKKTKVRFFPKTGRTHQLRIHSAHPDGLNTPILGDPLYGVSASRLYLHAEYLEFKHPLTGKILKFQIDSDF